MNPYNLVFGVLFILAAGWQLLVAPTEYESIRKLPRWMLPMSRLWPQRLDMWITKLTAGGLALLGVALVVAAFFIG